MRDKRGVKKERISKGLKNNDRIIAECARLGDELQKVPGESKRERLHYLQKLFHYGEKLCLAYESLKLFPDHDPIGRNLENEALNEIPANIDTIISTAYELASIFQED